MLKRLDIDRAIADVIHGLFELGIVEALDKELPLETTLDDDLGCDSQEIVSVCEMVSSLSQTAVPLDDNHVATLQDLVAYLSGARDPWLPIDMPYVLQGSITIDQPIDTVFGYIRDYRNWPDVLAHVKGIEPDVDDGRLQSFKMHIQEIGSKAEYAVKSWRYVSEEHRLIDFLQPMPPKGFRTHKGGWRFHALEDGKTRLISYHGFDLEPSASVADAMELIRKHIQAALTTWARYANG